MKKRILATTLSLAMALNFIGPSFNSISAKSYASTINTRSIFYIKRKTRQAYINLTDQQRAELERIDTNGNGLITIAEVLASGRYNLPIKKGVDFLYPFMIDSDNDGEVGENYIGNRSSSTNKIIDTNPVIEETESDEEAEEFEEKEEAIDKSDKEDDTEMDKDEESKNPSQYSKESLEKLRESIKKAKTEIESAEYLMENYPKTVANVKDKLVTIITKAKKLIERGEAILNK